jgi:hypothetical protein
VCSSDLFEFLDHRQFKLENTEDDKTVYDERCSSINARIHCPAADKGTTARTSQQAIDGILD